MNPYVRVEFESVGQRQHHQTESQRDANVRDGAVAQVVDHNSARSREDESERPQKFCSLPL